MWPDPTKWAWSAVFRETANNFGADTGTNGGQDLGLEVRTGRDYARDVATTCNTNGAGIESAFFQSCL